MLETPRWDAKSAAYLHRQKSGSETESEYGTESTVTPAGACPSTPGWLSDIPSQAGSPIMEQRSPCDFLEQGDQTSNKNGNLDQPKLNETASEENELGRLPAPNTTPSQGSALHSSGRCSPCAWFWKSSGCQNAANCSFCHSCPQGELKMRKKVKVMALRAASSKQSEEEEGYECEGNGKDSREDLQSASPQERDSLPGTTPANNCDDSSQAAAEGQMLSQHTDVDEQTRPEAGLVTNLLNVGPLPSHGSLLHGSGACRPCAWFWKPSGCKNAKDCLYCHLCPVGELKMRKKVKLAAMNAAEAANIADAGSLPDARNCDVAPDSNIDEEMAALVPSLLLDDPEHLTDCLDQETAPTEASIVENVDVLDSSWGMPVRVNPISSLNSDKSEQLLPDEPMLLLPPPGLSIPVDPPSRGSVLHESGDCSPCAWFWKPQGCRNGQQCSRCHLCPLDALKTRRKAKLAALRQQSPTRTTSTSTPTPPSTSPSPTPSASRAEPLHVNSLPFRKETCLLHSNYLSREARALSTYPETTLATVPLPQLLGQLSGLCVADTRPVELPQGAARCRHGVA